MTNELRKTHGPPKDESGRRIVERAVAISVNSFISSQAVTYPGESVPLRNGVSLRVEEENSHRIVFQMDMSITQWIKLQQSVIVGAFSQAERPRAELHHVPSELVLTPASEPGQSEPQYFRLAEEARTALHAALHEYEEAVSELEALHSEKAGRAAMAEGIRGARTAISRAAAEVQYAHRVLNEHVDRCLQTMLLDERFTDEQRAAPAAAERSAPAERSEAGAAGTAGES